MNKYRLAVNPYDIEKWVNDMARQGWHLTSFSRNSPPLKVVR